MNILITGGRATGKTILMEALKLYYEKRGDAVTVVDDRGNFTASLREYQTHLQYIERKIEVSKSSENDHCLLISQAPPSKIYRYYSTEEKPTLYDFVIQCTANWGQVK